MSGSSSETTKKQYRLTSKQQDAQDRRNRMTQRRTEMTQRIRKQKKSHYLAKKRGMSITTPPSNTTTTTSHLEVFPYIQSYCQSPTPESLQALHNALQQQASPPPPPSVVEENPLVWISQEQKAMAVTLLTTLRNQATASPNMLLLPTCLQILVPLTAIPSSSSSAGDNNYYGYTPTTWTMLVGQNADWINLLVQTIRSPQQQQQEAQQQRETACIIVGNLVGGEKENIHVLKQAGVVPALVSALPQEPSAAWALTNAIRHDTSGWAATYCSCSNDDNLGLSPPLLESLLLTPTNTSNHKNDNHHPPVVHVATQAAWMIASLTSREEAVVQYLVSHPTFVPTLIRCCSQMMNLSPGGCDDDDPTVPLVQALGNIACYEANVVPLLTLNTPPLVPLVGKLLEASGTTKTKKHSRELFLQVAWLAGCLLCDAGIANHPSTTITAPQLLPILFHKLSSSEYSNNNMLSLEEQREVTVAIWNALMEPPSSSSSSSSNVTPPTTTTTLVPLPTKDVIVPALRTLVQMISPVVDSDAVVASVHVMELLLKRDESLQIAFEEANIQEALEHVCDSALEEAAEVAANLLDDYFYKDDDDDYVDYDHHNGHDRETNLDRPMFVFSTEPSTQQQQPHHGMGRGRGAVIPSWMQKQQ